MNYLSFHAVLFEFSESVFLYTSIQVNFLQILPSVCSFSQCLSVLIATEHAVLYSTGVIRAKPQSVQREKVGAGGRGN